MSTQSGLPEGNTIGDTQRPIRAVHTLRSQGFASSGTQLKVDPVMEYFGAISKSQSPKSTQFPTPRSSESQQQLVQHQLQQEFMVQQEPIHEAESQGPVNHEGVMGPDYLPNAMNINSSVTNSEPQRKDFTAGTESVMATVPRKRSRSTNSASFPIQQYNFATRQVRTTAENIGPNHQMSPSSVPSSLNASYPETFKNYQSNGPSSVEMNQTRRQASGSGSSHPIDLKEYQIQGLDNGTISTNTMAAAAASAAMGSSGGMSPQQIHQLRQLQATYGNLQTNINKQLNEQQQQVPQPPQQYYIQARHRNQNQNQNQSEYSSPGQSVASSATRNNAPRRQSFNYQNFVPVQQQPRHQLQQQSLPHPQQPQNQYQYQQQQQQQQPHQQPQQQTQQTQQPQNHHARPHPPQQLQSHNIIPQGQPFPSQTRHPGIQYVSYQPGPAQPASQQQQQPQPQLHQHQHQHQPQFEENASRYMPPGQQSQPGQAVHQSSFYGPQFPINGKPQPVPSPAEVSQNGSIPERKVSNGESMYNSPVAGGSAAPIGYNSIPRGVLVHHSGVPSSGSTPITAKAGMKSPMNPQMVPGAPVNTPQAVPQSSASFARPLPEDLKRINANAAIIKLFEICEKICVRFGSVDINYWKEIMNEFFDENSTMSVNVRDHKVTRHYNFSHSILPLLCHAVASRCATSLELSQNFIRAEVLANGTIVLDCARFVQRWWYPDGSYKTRYGSLRVCFNRRNLIEVVSISVFKSSWGLEMAPLERFLTLHPGASVDAIKSNFLAFQGNNDLGFHDRSLRIMQIGDVMNLLRPLMYYHLVSGSSSPVNSLEAFNKAVINNDPKPENLPQSQDGHSIPADPRINQSMNQQQQLHKPGYPNGQNDSVIGINLNPKSMQVKPMSPPQTSSADFNRQGFQQRLVQQNIDPKNIPRGSVRNNVVLDQQKIEERRHIIQALSQGGRIDGVASVNHRGRPMQMKVKAFQPRHNIQQNRIPDSALRTWNIDPPLNGTKKRRTS